MTATIIHKGFRVLPDQREIIGGVVFFAVDGFADFAFCLRHHMIVDVGGEMSDHLARHVDEEMERWERDA